MSEHTGVRASLRAHWDEFFLARGDARDLGVVRVLLAGTLLVLSFWYQQEFPAWALVRPWVWQPVSVFRFMSPDVLSEPMLWMVLWAWRAALGLMVIGLWTRASSVVAALTGFVVLGLPQNFGKINHHYGLVMLCLMILAVSRSGDAWSIDRLRRIVGDARGPFAPDPPATGGEYRWPLALMQVTAVLVLWSAGIAKLRSPGPRGWIMTSNLYYTIIRHFYTHQPPVAFGLWLVQWPLLCRVLAAASLLLELTAPVLLLLHGWWRAILLLMLAGMMLGFGIVLGVLFIHFILALCILFVPWRELGAAIARRLPVRSFTLLFDGSCGLCRKTVAVISALDIMERVEIVTEPHGLASMRVVRSDGQRYEGFAAYRALAWGVPVWWPLLTVLYVPGVPMLGRAIYGRVSRGRHAAGCKTG